MATAKKSFVLEFENDKDTKGTRRFAEIVPEDAGEARIGSLYIRKFALPELGNPAKVRVTVEAV